MLGMSADHKLMSAKMNFFHSCFLAPQFGCCRKFVPFPSESTSQGALSSVVINSENAIATVFDYFGLGLAQLWRIGVIAWGVEIMRLDVVRERGGNDRKH